MKTPFTGSVRKLIRTFMCKGHDGEFWPVALVLFGVLVPAVCLVWFTNAAMRNERLAVRQRLADVYRVHLAASQQRLERAWREMAAELEQLTAAPAGPAPFARSVRSGIVGSAVLFDRQGRISD